MSTYSANKYNYISWNEWCSQFFPPWILDRTGLILPIEQDLAETIGIVWKPV